MTEHGTVPHPVDHIAVRGFSVRVIEGPDAGRSIAANEQKITIGSAAGNDLVLTDDTVSRHHLEIESTEAGIAITDHGSTNGTFAGSIRIQRGVVPAGAVLRLGRTSICIEDGDGIDLPLFDGDRFGPLLGRSRRMRLLMAQIERLAKNDVSILLLGETGTGKEVVARALHEASGRQSGPLETVDCGAQLPALIASELFGHEKGAFTGADQQHVGAFERGNGGTIFLDEIGELASGLQPMLLGVLERRVLRRVGGSEPRKVDVRLISATNRDLRAEVNAGTFRQDLYFRIGVVMLRIPPLRERPEDIPLLAEHFLRRVDPDIAISDVISPSAMSSLKTYHWPGNVRELRNFVEAAHAMGAPPRLEGAEPAPPKISGDRLDLPYSEARAEAIDEFEAEYLDRLMKAAKDNVSEASRRAKMNRGYLNELLKKHGMKDPS